MANYLSKNALLKQYHKLFEIEKMIKAEIIADSLGPQGNRCTSYVLTFPRHILAELNTHRMFSRNSASSRAVPFKTMLKRVQDDPFMPMAWQKDHSGMQGTEYEEDENQLNINLSNWLIARDRAVSQAKILNESGVTKQIVNRLLEPFMWHTAIVTATEYENFFHLRCPQYSITNHNTNKETLYRSKKDFIENFYMDGFEDQLLERDDLYWLKINKGAGEIHIMALAEAMWDARNESSPKQLKAGEWHIPFGENIDESQLNPCLEILPEDIPQKAKIATARCARVSYINYEGKDDYEADIELYNRLSGMGHWSPFEHCARVMTEEELYLYYRYGMMKNDKHESLGWCGNFRGFIQLRKTFQNENII